VRCVFSYKNCRCDRQCINTTTWQCLALLLCCYGERESRFLTAHQHKTGATPWGGVALGGGGVPPPTGTWCPPPNEKGTAVEKSADLGQSVSS